MDQVMQLPDHCFGRRFPVCVCPSASTGNTNWDISEVALPDRFVIWELVWWTDRQRLGGDYFRLALGDQLPATAAQMTALEPLIKGMGLQGLDPRQIPPQWRTFVGIRRLRHPVQATGRKLIAEVVSDGAAAIRIQFVMVISSFPTEVPDCLLWG